MFINIDEVESVVVYTLSNTKLKLNFSYHFLNDLNIFLIFKNLSISAILHVTPTLDYDIE